MRVFLFICFLVAAPTFLHAHAMGASLEKTVGPYVIDIGYDPEKPLAGDRLVFDFNLVTAVASTSVPFDYVWVRFRDGTETLLATGIARAEFGPTSLLYALPPEVTGDLTLSVRYRANSQTLAEAEFAIPAAPIEREVADYMPLLSALLGGLVAGTAAGFFIFRGRRVL